MSCRLHFFFVSIEKRTRNGDAHGQTRRVEGRLHAKKDGSCLNVNYDQFPYRRIHTPSPNLSTVNLHQACPLQPYSTILEGDRLYLAMEKKPINSSPPDLNKPL